MAGCIHPWPSRRSHVGVAACAGSGPMSELIQLPALDGSMISFVDRVVGSGQKKDCYLSGDGQYVVLWYREAISQLELARLQEIVGRYREQLFDGPAAAYW